MSKPRRIRLYIDDIIKLNHTIYLNHEHKNYLLNVMRCKDGDEIKVFNQNYGEWNAVINKQENCLIPKIKLRDTQLFLKHKIVLAFAPTKKYGEFVIEKATEMGVDCIIPIRTERSIVDKINYIRYRKTIIEALEQCGRIDLPKITDMIDLKDLKDTIHLLYNQDNISFIVCDLQDKLFNLNKTQSSIICIIIGPEGGFALQDYKIFEQIPVEYLKLSNNILRAETASIASIAIIQNLL